MKAAPGQELRNGFTTGSAVAAAAVAAFRNSADQVELLLPSGETLLIPVLRAEPGRASVVKDGGDDPDVTSGMTLTVTLSPCDGPAGPRDHEESADGLTLVIRGLSGVGVVTRPGLAVPVGKYAVNPGPRKMLLANLLRAGVRGRWLVGIEAADGETVAAETLNPTLGIVGGISILGNSGIVRPYSNAAYAATIRLQIRSFAASGGRKAALVTGNRTAEAVARDFPEIPPEGVVRMGDFVYIALRAAAESALPAVVVGCMPGKLFKYACEEKNTHAHKSKLDLTRLRSFGVDLPGVPLENMDSMGELSHHLAPEKWHEVLQKVYSRALAVLQSWAGPTRIEAVLYNEKGEKVS